MNLGDKITLFLPNNHSNPEVRFRRLDLPIESSVAQALTAFGWNQISQLEELERAALNSRNFRVTTIDGQWLLRQSLSPHSPERAVLESSVMLHCRERGVLVPTPLRTKDGQACATISTSDGLKYFTAAQFVPGKHFSGTLDELRSAARHTAHLTSALACFPGAREIAVVFTFLTGQYSTELLQSLGNLATDSSPLTGLFKENFGLISASINSVSERLQLSSYTPQLLHGDLHPHNFLMLEGQVSAILDFGEMRFGPRLEDLAYALYRLVRQTVVHERLTGHPELRDSVRFFTDCFLAEFSKIVEIDSLDRTQIGPMIKHIALKKIFHVLTQHFLHNNHHWDADFQKHLIAIHEAEYFG